ncbi:MAG TPA: hypothetical protein VIT65_22850 [Microlunatus sp.]
MSTAQPRRESAWKHFLEGKTPGQRLIIQLGAIATALLAIAGVVAGIVSFVNDQFGMGGAEPAGVTVVRTQQSSADAFVEMLVKADGGVVQLNHQLHGRRGHADVTLAYHCQSSGRCSTTRVQAPEDQPAELPPDGVWYRGCWAVTMDGNGFDAQPLDLELRKQDDTCPG